MRKPLFFIVIFLGICASAFAQKPTTVVVDKGTSSLAGFSSVCRNSLYSTMTGVIYNYYLADGLALRSQLRVAFGSDRKDKEDNIYTNTYDLLLGLGVQKSLIQSRMFNGYVGATALAGGMGNKNISNDTFVKTTKLEFGVRPFMGFEHYFVKNFFLGVEWGYDITFILEKAQNNTESMITSGSKEINLGDLSNLLIRFGFNF